MKYMQAKQGDGHAKRSEKGVCEREQADRAFAFRASTLTRFLRFVQDERTEEEVVGVWAVASYPEDLNEVVELAARVAGIGGTYARRSVGRSAFPSPSSFGPTHHSDEITHPWISPTTVTGAEMWTTLLSRMRTSLVFSQISRRRASPRSRFWRSLEMQASMSKTPMYGGIREGWRSEAGREEVCVWGSRRGE